MVRLPTEQRAGAIAQFAPEVAKKNDAKADAVIDYAKKVRDWPSLEAAIDAKLEDQVEFVRWWEESVRPNNRPKTNADPRYLSVSDAEEHTSITQQQVSKWRRRLREPEQYSAMLFGTAYHKAMAEANNTTATKWTGDPESYTPAKYIEAAREVLGSIDLDPASCMRAQETVRAAEWHDENENGLLQDWRGRVFLNPPYSYPLVGDFIAKLCEEHGAGNVTAAILLTNNNTDTKWFHAAAKAATAVCFTLGRINFYKDDGSVTQPTNGQTFFYFGNDSAEFRKTFESFGLVMRGG